MKLKLLVSVFFVPNEYFDLLFLCSVIETATPSQSLMILRCCGNLVPNELPENRTILAKEIWKTLNYIGTVLIISLFQLNLTQVYILY